MSEFAPDPFQPEGGSSKSRALKIGAIVVALLVLLGGVAYFVSRGNPEAAAPEPTPSITAPVETTPSEPTPTATAPASAAPAPSKPATPTGCTTAPGAIEHPVRFKVDARGVDSKMITTGTDPDGAPGAPPKSEPNTTGWFNGSPEVGTTQGNVMLTIHTYSPKNGANALGNKLYSDAGLKPGDIIRIIDQNGQQVCYRYRESLKIWVDKYDENSGVYWNTTGRPQLAIMICWDHNNKTEEWDSRIVFYADLIKPGEA